MVTKSLDDELLKKSALEYGTPLFVYDGDLIVQRYKDLYKLIPWPKLKIYYAMKANYNVAILKLLERNGAYIDTVSPTEIRLALKCGFSPDRLLFTANNMTDKEMEEVHGLNVLFNIGSLSRLEKYGKAYPGDNIVIRINPDVVAGENEKVQTAGALTKFGILMEDIDKAKEIINKYNLKVIGIHEHTGSGIAETEKVFQSMKNTLSIAKKEDFPDLQFIDFGGGFKVPYHPEEKRIDYKSFGREIVRIFKEFCDDYGRELEMYFEPGKYIVAESGYLVLQVNTLKNNRGRLIAGTDSGFSHLIRPMLYDAYHHIINITNPEGTIKKYDICGNICESGDCFAFQRDIAELHEGDIIAVQNAGAYCYSMASIYNLRPLPPEVLVENKKPRLVRKRMSNDELAEYIYNLYTD
ncbi:MAG: diaminopimelate decarboxylase [Promethearchaeota archaeon]